MNTVLEIPRPDNPEAQRLERQAWLSLALLRATRLAEIVELVKRLGSAHAAWNQVGKGRPPVPEAPEWEGCLVPSDPGYPERLLRLKDPPLRLFSQGRPIPEEGPCVGIVGTRRATASGMAVATELGSALSALGIPVVSGLARGIDGAAHRGCLREPGHPIAVQACSLELTYPSEHRRLKAEILRCGTVVSEYPHGTQPLRWRFPARNRIIAGLSTHLVVVEAGRKSGALITADMAADLGLEVMALPGSVGSPVSHGTNKLLRDGATFLRGVDDLLQALTLTPPSRAVLEPDEHSVLERLAAGPATPDELAAATGLTAPALARALLGLELKKQVSRGVGGLYLRL